MSPICNFLGLTSIYRSALQFLDHFLCANSAPPFFFFFKYPISKNIYGLLLSLRLVILQVGSRDRTRSHARDFSLSKMLFLSRKCHMKNLTVTLRRGARTQMWLRVSASNTREMSCAQMWQCPGVLCNMPREFSSSFPPFFFFFVPCPPTTISAALGPYSLTPDLFVRQSFHCTAH